MGDGETKKFHCGVTGRYLVVLLEKTGSLTLCEVEVFEGNILHSGKIKKIYTARKKYLHQMRQKY